MKKKALGLAIATAAAIVFVAAPVISNVANATSNKIPCYGVNSCKGKGACKTASNACKGQNTCKGKGFLMKTAAKCTKMNGSETMPTSS